MVDSIKGILKIRVDGSHYASLVQSSLDILQKKTVCCFIECLRNPICIECNEKYSDVL